MATVKCVTCEGKGTVRKEVSLGKFARVNCPAKCKNGWVKTELI